ncbi:MAG: sulfatase/phosphatase domain-containing protein, partial [Planctomycetota bacterium]|nr:sulfatase/phosphatase domain-containing protein [Planctomycetota bacterium]
PPAWEFYDLKKDPAELDNVYDDPAYRVERDRLKDQFATLRKKIGDDGTHYPQCEMVVKEFWDYDENDQAKAIAISHDFKRRREAMLKSSGNPKPDKPDKRKPTPIKKNSGGWILPAPSEKRLRNFMGFKEVSRDAVYKIIGRGPDSFNVDNAHLFSGDPPSQKEHAFHSAEGIDQPCVLVKLKQPTSIRAVQIINRKSLNPELKNRSASLAIWTSADRKVWKKVWQASQARKQWSVKLETTEPTQYLRVGLSGRGTLHLNQIVIFGR